MPSVSVTGIGSGIDIESLVTELVGAQRQPTENRFDLKEAEYQAKLSAVGSLKSALSKFQSGLSGLNSVSSFLKRSSTVSDSTILSASTTTIAEPGDYEITVSSLAKAHSLSSQSYNSISDTVGEGTLTIRFGTTVYDVDTDTYTSFTQNAEQSTATITIGSGDNTLQGVRDAINKADAGVSASIVYDGTGYRLMLRSESGVKQSMEVTVDDSDANDLDASGLSVLAFNSSATNMTENVAAADAALSINGLAITSASNTLTEAIKGVTLSLTKADATNPVSLSIAHDVDAVQASIEGFAESYNELLQTVDQLSSYSAETQSAGLLIGDPILRGIENTIRTDINQLLSSYTTSYTSLNDIGMSTQADGSVKLDSEKLTESLAADFDGVAQLFAAMATATNNNVSFIGATDNTEVGNYSVEVTQLATRSQYTGDAISGYAGTITIDADNDTFAISVDGTQSAQLTLTHGSYSGATLASALQSLINGDSNLKEVGAKVTISFDTDHFVLTSDRFGAKSSVTISNIDTNFEAQLGLAEKSGSSAVDVQGSIGGVVATGNGQQLIGAGKASGLTLLISGSTTGNLGGVSFVKGVASRLSTSLDNILAASASLAAKESGLESNLKDLETERDKLNSRMNALETRLRTQFAVMDAFVAEMKSTGDFLSQQLASLAELSKPRKS
ncbi:MAG TPA: flagellar hook protein [Gammaproteobacteria bacterium]|nr:flagellar hook protein [Gammaproteobacteria bacterium]